MQRLLSFSLSTLLIATLFSSPAWTQDGVEKLDGSWQVKQLGTPTEGQDFISFGVGNSARWYHFFTAEDCWTSRHHYRIKDERMIFSPPLPDQRTWWSPDFETPARIELLQRVKTEEGRASQRVQLTRASVSDPGCTLREPTKNNG